MSFLRVTSEDRKNNKFGHFYANRVLPSYVLNVIN